MIKETKQKAEETEKEDDKEEEKKEETKSILGLDKSKELAIRQLTVK